MSTQLQLAIDFGAFGEAVALARRLHPHVERIEIGTPLVLRYGVELVRAVKQACPDRVIVADFKIADAGEHEAHIALDAGADVVTVLSYADDQTIAGCVRAARATGGRVLVDLISHEAPAARAVALQAMDVDELCLHTATDTQPSGTEPLAPLRALRQQVTAAIAVAGGISLETLGALLDTGVDIIIVGSAITAADNPERAAAAFAERIRNHQS